MTGIILAGGKGSRLGNINKPLIKIGPLTLIERVIPRLREAGVEKIICVGGQSLPPASCLLPSIPDIIPHQGPLVGLYSGLVASTSFYNFVVAGDMPFLSPNLIRYMKDKAGASDILIPKTQRGIEPLHAIYSKNCIEIIKRKMSRQKEKLSIESIFGELKVEYILEDEIQRFSRPEIAFFNINTSEDIEKAKRLLRKCNDLATRSKYSQ